MLDTFQPKTSSGTIGDTGIVLAYFHPSPLPQAAKDAVLGSFGYIEPVVEYNSGLTGYYNVWAVKSLSMSLVEIVDRNRIEGKYNILIKLTGWDNRGTYVKFMETQDLRRIGIGSWMRRG